VGLGTYSLVLYDGCDKMVCVVESNGKRVIERYQELLLCIVLAVE